ncbi:MAG: DUF2064 domain-containing protein [Chloroflexota bacterium]
MTAVLYIAARAPRPGFAKTRLGRAIGHVQANALYTAFLQDLARRLALFPFPVGWYVTPPDAWDDLAQLVRPELLPPAGCQHAFEKRQAVPNGVTPPALHGPVLTQGDGDWAARQQALFLDAPARGETRTVLIASDSPQVSVEALREAFDLLATHDVVLGPVDDGGYYLIGMRGPWPLLGGVPMSTSTVLSEIVARARGLGLTVGFVEPTFDVDDDGDLARLAEVAATRPDLVATRAALAELGCQATASHASAALPAGVGLAQAPCPLCPS